MSVKNTTVCSYKNEKIVPSSICRRLGRVWHPLLRNTFHWGCFWQRLQSLVHKEKRKLVFSWNPFFGQKTAGVGAGDSRVAGPALCPPQEPSAASSPRCQPGLCPCRQPKPPSLAGLFPSGICTGDGFLSVPSLPGWLRMGAGIQQQL